MSIGIPYKKNTLRSQHISEKTNSISSANSHKNEINGSNLNDRYRVVNNTSENYYRFVAASLCDFIKWSFRNIKFYHFNKCQFIVDQLVINGINLNDIIEILQEAKNYNLNILTSTNETIIIERITGYHQNRKEILDEISVSILIEERKKHENR